MKRILLVLALISLTLAFFLLDLDRFLTLGQIKAYHAQLQAAIELHPLAMAGGFFLTYIISTALSLPGAAVLSLAIGALFGFWRGLVLVSFASSIGATLAFLVSRYLLRALVEQRFGDRLALINQGLDKDGPLYLFSLRLVPLFPFFLINLLMGLTRMSPWTFYWVSQVGMLAGTAVYINAGTRLAQIDSIATIFSPGLLASFTLLGLFPLLARWLVDHLRLRHRYAQWSRPRHYDRNLIVIGGGAAGLVSAYIATTLRAKVTLVEAAQMGGDCLNHGCVPSKTLIHCAAQAQQIRQAHQYGIQSVKPVVDWPRVMARVQAVIAQIQPHDSVERYRSLGVDVHQGRARILDPWRVEITGHDGSCQVLTTRAIILATGAQPRIPDIAGLDRVGYLTSDTLWQVMATRDRIPSRLVILGGGPIGCEMAQAFARLGTTVWLVAQGPRLLAREDPDLAAFAAQTLRDDGVQLLLEHRVIECLRTGSRKHLLLEHQGQSRHLEFDDLLIAIGRRPRLSGYGLEELGLNTEHTVSTNQYLETLLPNILAAGDVVGLHQFTHAAAHQAWYATINGLFGHIKRLRINYRSLPHTTFLDPELAQVGLTETEARAQGIQVEVTRFELSNVDRALTDGHHRGFIKVLTRAGKDRIVGVAIAAPHGGELLAEFVLAMRHGLGLSKILATIHTYPTLAESNRQVAGRWKQHHAPSRLLDLLERYHRLRRR